MKRTVTGVLLVAGWMIAGTCVPAQAIDLYGFASYWDKGDVKGKGGLGIGVGTPLISEHLRLDGRVYFIGASSLSPGNELTMIPFDFGIQLHLMPNAELDPYGLAGISYIYADADRSDVDSSFGTYLGGGLEWSPVSFLRLFGECIYRFQELNGRYQGNTVDVSGLTANLGVKFIF
ncbi:MAG: porin family protein [Desulfobulbus sp.]|nr:porin family protein [Desulfobulbus sp.]